MALSDLLVSFFLASTTEAGLSFFSSGLLMVGLIVGREVAEGPAAGLGLASVTLVVTGFLSAAAVPTTCETPPALIRSLRLFSMGSSSAVAFVSLLSAGYFELSGFLLAAAVLATGLGFLSAIAVVEGAAVCGRGFSVLSATVGLASLGVVLVDVVLINPLFLISAAETTDACPPALMRRAIC
jgi:hypothetical protein